MIDPIILKQPDQVDMAKHGVIEASAGTGKTYTIEHLVVNLLREQKVDRLNQVLIMTFTEKATGELKNRVRANIRNALKESPNKLLRESLDNFDTASIFTIHGFCNRVLQQYAFENGEQFSFEVVEDPPLYGKMLYEQMRGMWNERYGDDLPQLLELSGFNKHDMVSGGSRLEKLIIDIAMQYRQQCDTLYPPAGRDVAGSFRELQDAIVKICAQLEGIIGHVDKDDLTQSDLYLAYKKLNINVKSLGKRLRTMVLPLLELLLKVGKRENSVSSFAAFIRSLTFTPDGFHELEKGWLKSGPNYADELPALPEIIELLEKLRCLPLEDLCYQLAVNAVIELKADVIRYKKERGVISYDDMIRLVYEALVADESPLRAVLQKNYIYAIVDEFQDTDMLQWTILKKVFLEGKNNRLFIIGDPKQAIYSFRGADVRTYYQAKQDMIAEHNAVYYSLVYNYRSQHGLIDIFNCLFEEGTWFSEKEIVYTPSLCPDIDENSLQADDHVNMIAVDLGECSGGVARDNMAVYIAHEIHALLNNPSGPIPPGEIVVLLRKWGEALPVERALEQLGIKYSYYKKEGLFQTREAVHVYTILESVIDPANQASFRKALLSDFFGVTLENVGRYDAVAVDHPLLITLDTWSSLAQSQQWGRLFHSLLEDSGILYRLLNTAGGERSIANYKQIFNVLTVEAYKTNCDSLRLLKLLSTLVHQEHMIGQNFNILMPESEEGRVKLMTIHASKGLQFDAVFVAGGFTSKDINAYWPYHYENKKVFDLVKRKEMKEHYLMEQSGEDDRLFYVAMTRAKKRLYVPFYSPDKRGKASSGYAGNKLVDAVERVKGKAHIRIVEHTDVRPVTERPLEKQERDLVVPVPLFNQHNLSFHDRSLSIDSFSRIKSHSKKDNLRQANFGDVLEDMVNDEHYEVPELFLSENDEPEKPQMLPGGSTTGTMLHDILENIDYASVNRTAEKEELAADPLIMELVEGKIDLYLQPKSIEEKDFFLREVFSIIWNTLKTRLGADFSICEVTDKVHEMEFYFPFPPLGTGNTKKYLHGFIDLVFLMNGKLYILDWKSNYIAQGYSFDAVKQSILDSSYDLQYTIYARSLFKWQRLVNPSFNYDQDFGGIYYLYLRGMDVSDPSQGVYFYRPDREDEFTIKDKVAID